ncbi:MAG: glycosyltransferase family 2 protein [candidate division KSB1 bacterium]|nr:glycosyltransferase family 2 protein [candidate division KSB1 bacterium]
MDPIKATNHEALKAFQKAQEEFRAANFEKAEQLLAFYQKNIDVDAFSRTDNRQPCTVLVSVVIVAYATNELLIECLDSLSRQSDPRFEIIVVNNGQNDRVREELDRRPLLHIQCPMNMILSEGRNIGVCYARGTYVAFLDDDARAGSGYIASIICAFSRYRIAALRERCCPSSLKGITGVFGTMIREMSPYRL